MSKKFHYSEIPFQSSTIENIDFSLYEWINDEMNVFSTTKQGWEKVRVIWVSAERSKLSKNSKEEREKTGALVFPLITVERKSINKDLGKKGKTFATIPLEQDAKGGNSEIVIARRIKQDKTANFVNAETKQKTGQINFPRKSNKIVYETMSVPLPVHIEVDYLISMRTLYQQQINEMLQPFLTKTLGINYFVLKRNGHRYEAFMDKDFKNNSNVAKLNQEERFYETEFNIKVLGYLMGADKNDKQPKIVIRENAVTISVSREYAVLDDKTLDGNGYVGTEGLVGGKVKR